MKVIKKNIGIILLTLIILVASALRLWGLGNMPPSPDWDEAALGYNAYSIMQTGRDEYGKFMPIVLQSFDDYKPAVYAYFIIPFIQFFGLDVVSVRLPSAVFGILTVLATYFLTYELFKRKSIALATAFLLAISPWHIQFSRIAFETNMGLAFNVFGALFFIKGLKKPWLLIVSALFMGLCPSVYQSDRAFTPLLTIGLILIFRKQLFSLPKKYLITAFLVGLIAILPLVNNIVTNNKSFSRLKGVSIFTEQTAIKLETEKRYLDDKRNNNSLGVLFHNKWIGYSREIFSGYFSHYNINWLFINGDLARHHAPSMGLMYLWELPFLLFGIYSLIFFKFPTKTKILIFTWFLLAPVPAAITNGVPHSVRALNFLPTFQIFTAIGLISVYQFITEHKKSRLFTASSLPLAFIYLLFAIFNFLYFLNQYFVQQNYFTSFEWQYGYKEAVSYIKSIEYKYDKIIVQDSSPLDQSYIFFLFYLQYPPPSYQKEGNSTSGFEKIHKFSKYEFRNISWNRSIRNHKILYVARPEDIPEGEGNNQKVIYYLNGKPAIKIIEG